LHCVAPVETVPPTTTAAPVTTTLVPITTVITQPPTTIVTLPPTTAATVPPTTPTNAAFFEDFNDPAAGFARFHRIVYNREGVPGPIVYRGDHDHSCGNPQQTSRDIHAERYEEYFYVCTPTSGDSHWMSSLGDVSGYSIIAFCPDVNTDRICDPFSRSQARTVSVNVSMLNMGGGRWWELKIIPVGTQDLSVIDVICSCNGGPAGTPIPEYDDRSVVIGNGPFGGSINFTAGGNSTNPTGWMWWYHDEPTFGVANAYKDDFSTRVPMSVTDNGDGTVTWTAGAPGLPLFQQWTKPGSFPENFKVVFADHAYTPDKPDHGPMPGRYTTHWDNLRIGGG